VLVGVGCVGDRRAQQQREEEGMSEFERVGEAGEVAAGDMSSYTVGDRTVAVANVGGSLHAFDDVCTHQGCSLAEGDLDGTIVECPCHGSQLDVTSGAVVNGPAADPVDTFEVREEGSDLQIALD
jgi:nitrite reductase/ring-hydroxylating ferredoxin subunit